MHIQHCSESIFNPSITGDRWLCYRLDEFALASELLIYEFSDWLFDFLPLPSKFAA